MHQKKKRAKKRKATIPVGGANKKVIESATTSPSESRSNTDDEMVTDGGNANEKGDLNQAKDNEWESELMLVDSAWSTVRGKKHITDDMATKITPIIIRHDRSRIAKQIIECAPDNLDNSNNLLVL